ncbi:hypothetical protein ACI3L1_09290 [Deinococcus sp. SM5_A1]|uniref:hypothetical protein n=1 Tax=Deinococcus sp. SM5_A1 TaxID=3379094 RepID=UPI00385D68D9
MKVLKRSQLLPQPVVARSSPAPARLGNHVIMRTLVNGETCVVMGLESDRPATLAWLEKLTSPNLR